MTVLRVRRTGSSAVHALRLTSPGAATVPSEKHGRMVRVLKASKVQVACGATLHPTDDRPVLVLRYAAEITCRGCARAAT